MRHIPAAVRADHYGAVMSLRKPLAQVIGLAGCAAAGYGFHEVAISTTCGPATDLACPPDWHFFLVFIGMFTAIPAIVFGGGALVFIGLFVGIGGGFLSGGLRVEDSGERVTFVIIGGVLLGLALLPLVGFLFYERKQRRVRRLLADGVAAIGTVTSVRDTGVTVNRNPRVELGMRIAPRDGSAPFDASKAFTVSRVSFPVVGQCFPVWFDPDKPNDFAYGSDMNPNASPEVRALFAAAAEAQAATAVSGAMPGGDSRSLFETAFAGAAAGPGAVGAAGAGGVDRLERLAKLNELRLAGALTEAEFEVEKAKLLRES